MFDRGSVTVLKVTYHSGRRNPNCRRHLLDGLLGGAGRGGAEHRGHHQTARRHHPAHLGERELRERRHARSRSRRAQHRRRRRGRAARACPRSPPGVAAPRARASISAETSRATRRGTDGAERPAERAGAGADIQHQPRRQARRPAARRSAGPAGRRGGTVRGPRPRRKPDRRRARLVTSEADRCPPGGSPQPAALDGPPGPPLELALVSRLRPAELEERPHQGGCELLVPPPEVATPQASSAAR